ncbi:MAG: IPT/TIG domain-containing protein [Acidobacteriota bacterium]
MTPDTLLPRLSRALIGGILLFAAAALLPAPASASLKKACDRDDDENKDYSLCEGHRVDAEREFEGDAARIRVVFRRADQAPRRGALISVSGFGTSDNSKCDASNLRSVTEGERSDLARWTDAWRAGFDLYLVKWCKPYDLVQRNAYGLQEVLQQIDDGAFSGEPYGRDDRTMMVAGSMGGVVARYALTELERNGFDHEVDTFVSFDSPQEGAYLPIGVQHAGQYLKRLGETFSSLIPADQLERINGADVPAARQLLLMHHESSGPDPLHRELWDELDAFGYPALSRNVALSNGSGERETRKRDFHWESDASFGRVDETYKLEWKVFGETVWSAKLKVRISGPFAFTVQRLDQTNQEVFRGRYQTPALQINGKNVSLSVIDLADLLDLPDFIPADSFLKPYVTDIENLVRSFTGGRIRFDESVRVNAPFAYELASSGTSEKYQELADGLSGNGFVSGSLAADVFIPATSAIGLPGDPLRDLSQVSPAATPFDHFYLDTANRAHLERSDAMEGALCKETHELLGEAYVNSISPALRPQGGVDFMLTVHGGLFTPGSVVVWHDPSTGRERTVDLETTYLDGTTLEAFVPEELIERLTECPASSDSQCERRFPYDIEPTQRLPISVSVRNDGSHPLPAPSEATVAECQWGGADFEILDLPLEISPALPTPTDFIEVTYGEDWRDTCFPEFDRLERSGRQITVFMKPRDGFCLFAVSPFETAVPLGQLPAGQYDLEFVVDSRTGGALLEQSFNVRYPAPVLQKALPNFVSARSGDTEITLRGHDFSAGVSMATLDGRPLETTFLDESTLTALVPESELQTPRSRALTVVTEDPQGPRSSDAVAFTVGPPQIDLDALTPSRTTEGSPTLVVSLRGAGFSSRTQITWETAEATVVLPTSFRSSAELVTTIDRSLLRTAGTFLVTARDGDLESEPQNFVVEGDGTGGGGSASCTPSAERLCLNDDRFAVTFAWQTRSGERGDGQVTELTADTGYVWFFDEDNVEAVVKVLDACGVNQRYWVFLGGLTDVAVETTVTDTATGDTVTYTNPQGTAFRPELDTSAFATCSASRPDSSTKSAAASTSSSRTLFLNDGRFRVEADWTARSEAGVGTAASLTDDTGTFWFFDPANVEVVLKVLDGCAINGHYWVFAGGLTDVGVQLRLRDQQTGAVVRYENPRGSDFQPVQDTRAFRCDGS